MQIYSPGALIVVRYGRFGTQLARVVRDSGRDTLRIERFSAKRGCWGRGKVVRSEVLRFATPDDAFRVGVTSA